MKFNKFRSLSKGKKIGLGLVIVVVLALGAALALGLFNKNQPEEPQTQKYYSQLTGLEVSKDISERPVLGIMIENSRQARPQTGLDSAGIVFEAVTEGGITRYLALYQADIPETVGPVRSLRTHFLNWLMGFDASVAHVGGSAEALQLADERDAKSLNQFKYGEPYFRDSSRAAPHNAYVKTADLLKLQDELGHEQSQFMQIPREDSAPQPEDTEDDQSQPESQAAPPQNPAKQEAGNITIDFSSPLYEVEFRYQPASDSYTRYLNGKPHIDEATGQPITVKNLVVIKAKGLSAGLDVLGTGEALVFNNGTVEKARWQQPDFQERIKILDDQNNEISLLRGDSWFAAVAKDRPVSFE